MHQKYSTGVVDARMEDSETDAGSYFGIDADASDVSVQKEGAYVAGEGNYTRLSGLG